MLFNRKKPTKQFDISRDEDRRQSEEERRNRIQIYSVRTKRKTGKKSMVWLILLLLVVGGLFWYLTQI